MRSTEQREPRNGCGGDRRETQAPKSIKDERNNGVKDFGVLAFLTRRFLFSFVFVFPIAFLLNKYIVFTASELRGRIQLFRYGLTVLSTIGLNYLFLKIFVEGFQWYATPSKGLTTILVAVYSYFTQQYFSFKVRKYKN